MPRPNLRADVINRLPGIAQTPEGAGEAKIKSGIVHQNNSIRFDLTNFSDCLSKLFPKITVLPDDLPQTEDGCLIDPIVKIVTGALFHLCAAATNKPQLWIDLM